jgi:hypothetical protein
LTPGPSLRIHPVTRSGFNFADRFPRVVEVVSSLLARRQESALAGSPRAMRSKLCNA